MQTLRWRAGVTGLLAGALALSLAACTPDGQAPASETATPDGPARVTLGVYGPDAVTSVYSQVAAQFSSRHPEVSVDVKPYASREQALADVQRNRGTSGGPDIFLSDKGDLDQLLEDRLSRPVSDLLTARNVDLGDNYQRIGIEDFSQDNALQCMPVEVSPMVVYYNADLVQLSALRPAGVAAPNASSGWRFNDFVTAIQQATAKGRATRGFAVEPDIDKLAPFLLSGGSSVVDDVDDPTRLELSEGSGLDVMQRLLPVVRNPSSTFTPAQLAKRSALARFKAGTLGMMLGYRDLTPQLRATKGLSFGVMPIPRLGPTATTGRTSGFCVSRHVEQGTTKDKAVGDLLAYLVGDEPSKRLAATGYVVPANLTALNSDDFTQTDDDPLGGATVFSGSVRFIRPLPTTSAFDQALAAADAVLRPLFNESVSGPLDEDQLQQRLLGVDQAAQDVLQPGSVTPSASPSASPSS